MKTFTKHIHKIDGTEIDEVYLLKEDVLKLIKVKMRHENRNLVLSILSDLCGEIEGRIKIKD